jgi:NAD-dependent deacetylase
VARALTAVDRLAGLVREAGSVVALTGAGLSVPSGIPDFRSPATGLWANVDPMEVAHIDAWRRDPERFWRFYGDRFQALDGKRPNGAHAALVALERRGHLHAVVTQNIDMLHRAAGTATLVEVHGSIEHSVCLFGEWLPEEALDHAFALAAGADLLLCIGTSLEVHPIAQLPGVTRGNGGEVAVITQGPTAWDDRAAVKLDGDVVAEMQALVAAL